MAHTKKPCWEIARGVLNAAGIMGFDERNASDNVALDDAADWLRTNVFAGYTPDAVAEVIEALEIMASAFAHEARNIEQTAALYGAETALTRLRSIDNA